MLQTTVMFDRCCNHAFLMKSDLTEDTVNVKGLVADSVQQLNFDMANCQMSGNSGN